MYVATSRGYHYVLLGKMVVSPQDEDLDGNSPSNKANLKGWKENKKVYNDLILACSGEIGFAIVDKSVTRDLPDGDTELIWQELRR